MRPVRIWIAALAVVVMALPALAAAETATSEVQKFGEPVTITKPVDVRKLEKRPAKFVGQTVRLEGVVKNVCQGRGCWVEVRGARGGSFLAKSLDESLLLPKNCKGWNVVVQGTVVSLPQDGHDHDHGDQGEAAHECPQPEYVVSSQGVELIAAKAK
jgi:hypothetical protein